MVVRAHDRVQETNDPTAHAVVVALRETARKLGPSAWPTRRSSRPRSPARCASAPCSRATSRRSSSPLANTRDGAAGSVIQLAQHPSLPRRIKVVSGIRRDEAEALFAAARRVADRVTAPAADRLDRPRFGILSRGEVSEWLMVPLSKSGVRKHRGFESRPLRHTARRRTAHGARWRLRSSLTHLRVRSLRCSDAAFA